MELNKGKPLNPMVNAMLTDLYQITMAYGYWKQGKHDQYAVFDLFFRKNPFHGEYTIFAGLAEAMQFVNSFSFSESDISYLKEVLEDIDEDFLVYLRKVDTSEVKIYAMEEGTIAFPRTPVIRVEGPLIVCQLLETTLLNTCNYASLMATNSARFVNAAGDSAKLVEFGLRRAQGPDGAISASRYSYIGGFHGTSNVLAGKLFGIPISGTHAHAFVQSFASLDEVKDCEVDGKNLSPLVSNYRTQLGYENTNDGELAAFISYASAFKTTFLALVDTYDTLHSGIPNFVCVALALHELGYKAKGIRLDSGDLAYLSKKARELFQQIENDYGIAEFGKTSIVASNDINEPALHSLRAQNHQIDIFGVGTHLVTCQAQPALGMVYKLVQLNGDPRIKLSNDVTKLTICGSKKVYRLYGKRDSPVLDLLALEDEEPPAIGEKILCHHPFLEDKRVYVMPTRVEELLKLQWDGQKIVSAADRSLDEIRSYVREQISNLREIRDDILRSLNPTPYKISVTKHLYVYMHKLWQRSLPIQCLEE